MNFLNRLTLDLSDAARSLKNALADSLPDPGSRERAFFNNIVGKAIEGGALVVLYAPPGALKSTVALIFKLNGGLGDTTVFGANGVITDEGADLLRAADLSSLYLAFGTFSLVLGDFARRSTEAEAIEIVEADSPRDFLGAGRYEFGERSGLSLFEAVTDASEAGLGGDIDADLDISTGRAADTIVLGPGNDTAKGGNKGDKITGKDGNDSLDGENGNDTLTGGDGNDMLDGGAQDDRLNGGNGADTLNAGAGNDTVNGGNGNDVVTTGKGKDTVNTGKGKDTVSAEGGSNTITTGNGADQIILANSRNDQVDSGKGDDIFTVELQAGVQRRMELVAGQGDDAVTLFDTDPSNPGTGGIVKTGAGSDQVTLFAQSITVNTGANDDTVTVAADADDATIRLGRGNDTFQFFPPAEDGGTITLGDFTPADDRLDFTSLQLSGFVATVTPLVPGRFFINFTREDTEDSVAPNAVQDLLEEQATTPDIVAIFTF